MLAFGALDRFEGDETLIEGDRLAELGIKTCGFGHGRTQVT